jgi:hypothetical protein
MNKNSLPWLYIGIITFALVLGLLVGASNSPLVGVVISSIFGVGVAVLGLFSKKGDDGIKSNTFGLDMAAVGKFLTTFSIFLLIGAFLGILYRDADPESKGNDFVWNKDQPPSSTYEALDWISVTELLQKKGFTMQQIHTLYTIRAAELKDSANDDYGSKKYSEQLPYFKMLLSTPQEAKKGRGPASE